MAPAQWHETIHIFEHSKLILRGTCVFQNFFLCQCQLQCKQICLKLVQCHAHAELFCNISLHGKRTQPPIAIVLFCSFGLNFMCCLHLNYHKTQQFQTTVERQYFGAMKKRITWNSVQTWVTTIVNHPGTWAAMISSQAAICLPCKTWEWM